MTTPTTLTGQLAAAQRAVNLAVRTAAANTTPASGGRQTLTGRALDVAAGIAEALPHVEARYSTSVSGKYVDVHVLGGSPDTDVDGLLDVAVFVGVTHLEWTVAGAFVHLQTSIHQEPVKLGDHEVAIGAMVPVDLHPYDWYADRFKAVGIVLTARDKTAAP